MWDLVGKPEDRFSHSEAHIIQGKTFLLHIWCAKILLTTSGVELEASHRKEGDAAYGGLQPDTDEPIDVDKPTTSSTSGDDALSVPGAISVAGSGASNMPVSGASSMADKLNMPVSGASSMADQPLQFEMKQASTPAVNVKQGVALSDIGR